LNRNPAINRDLALLSVLLCLACRAEAASRNTGIRLPRLFCDNMILQQQTKNTFWGWAQPGEPVTVKASWGASASTRAGADGKWKLFLDTPRYGAGHSLMINDIEIRNVAVGEVWLCAGQSNMGWAMGNCFEADREADVDLPDFRIFKSAREHWHEPLEVQRDRLSRWKTCTPESAAETSAVSYWFGKKLHQELGVPVGILVQAFAGTPIEGWMPWEIQKDDARARAHKAALDENAGRIKGRGETHGKALAKHAEELAEYSAKIDAGETMKNAWKALSPPIITKPADLGHQYPAHIYNAMIHPIRPYGIRGAIWYQGERNSKDVPQALHYRNQLAMLITNYRSSWHALSGGNVAKDFPFQFTQLPSWTPPQAEPVEGLTAPWAVSRESMLRVDNEMPNTGMAVTIDTGDATALHPKNKKPIGLRHAYLALKNTYGKDFVDGGPRYRKQTVNGDQIIIEFDSTGSGMVAAKTGKPDAFAIAGRDQKWHWADAEINGSTVVVSSPEVSKPVAVRYAWAMNPSQRNLLYNKEGLPASPFRTDDWPLYDPDAEIVTVVKPAKPEAKTPADWERPVMTQ
jgi:sialate O-acetylesterase